MPRRSLTVLFGFFATILLLPPAIPRLCGQARTPKPVLIRDTDAAEGKEEAEATKEKELNPALAEQNLKVGDFYLKRKNYGAAVERYRDAVEYQPSLLQAYEALARAYEKIGENSKAAEAYREFIRRNPDSPKIPDVNSRIAKLEKRG
jgi:outer membrane protein assembly factor BamD (BamD/ComL family)